MNIYLFEIWAGIQFIFLILKIMQRINSIYTDNQIVL